MPNSNDFTPFATAVGANVLPAATWTADPAKAAGFQSGMALSNKLNTVWRQAMFVGAMIAQFTADNGPGNVQDNGNLPQLESQFEAALVSYLKGFFLLNPGAPTFWVSTSGSDTTGDGSSGNPWATGQHAVNTISAAYATPSTITVEFVGAGPYPGITVPPSFIGNWNFIGQSGSCAIHSTSSTVAPGRGFSLGYGVNATINGFSFASYYEAIALQSGGSAVIENCSFTPPVAGLSSPIVSYGGAIGLYGNISFANGTYVGFVTVETGGQINVAYSDVYTSIPTTLAYGTSTVTTGTMIATTGGTISLTTSQITQTGTVTGPKYITSTAGGINSHGAGTGYLFGSVAGTANSPGWYT